jgi:hypothetical protein
MNMSLTLIATGKLLGTKLRRMLAPVGAVGEHPTILYI